MTVAEAQCLCYGMSLSRLVQQAPAAMSERCVEWSGLVYPLLLHLNPKLRESAVTAMETALPVLMSKQSAVAACLASDLKDVSEYTLTLSCIIHRNYLCWDSAWENALMQHSASDRLKEVSMQKCKKLYPLKCEWIRGLDQLLVVAKTKLKQMGFKMLS